MTRRKSLALSVFRAYLPILKLDGAQRRGGTTFASQIRTMSILPEKSSDELSELDGRDNVVRLVFQGSPSRYNEFCSVIKQSIPPDTAVVLRGSAITGQRWRDGAPFDAEGPGTSDLDLTLVGSEAVALFKITGFFVPGVHSRPISEDDPDIAPDLLALRDRLQAMVSRPVHIQASREFVQRFRGDVLGQPYLTLIEKDDRT